MGCDPHPPPVLMGVLQPPSDPPTIYLVWVSEKSSILPEGVKRSGNDNSGYCLRDTVKTSLNWFNVWLTSVNKMANYSYIHSHSVICLLLENMYYLVLF